MEGKKPQFVFYQPEVLALEELIIPIRLHQRLEELHGMCGVEVPSIIFAPAGIGISCGRIALAHCERAIMFVVTHKPESTLSDKILFDLSELITERPQKLEMMIIRSPVVLVTAIERLMADDCLQLSAMPIIAREHFDCETFINLQEIKTKPQKPVKPLNKLFNSQSRQNIKHFMRKK